MHFSLSTIALKMDSITFGCKSKRRKNDKCEIPILCRDDSESEGESTRGGDSNSESDNNSDALFLCSFSVRRARDLLGRLAEDDIIPDNLRKRAGLACVCSPFQLDVQYINIILATATF